MYFEKKIIYLLDQPLDDFNIERFFINEIEKKGWTVEIWDFTKLYYKLYHQNYYKDRKLLADKRLKVINSYDDFKNRVSKNTKNTFYFDHLSRGAQFFIYRLRNYLKNKNKKRIVFSLANFPVPIQNKNFIKLIQNNNPKSLIKKLSQRLIIGYYKSCDKPDFYFSGGNFSRKTYLAKAAKHIVDAHNFDFDRYLKLKKKENTEINKNTAIFIDQDMCFHYDQFARLSKPFVSPKHYFPSLIKFFDNLQKTKKINTKISLHPRSNPNRDYVKFYKNICISKLTTAQNIFQSEIVIAHYSTSIQLAILLYKQIIFITTNELEKSERNTFVEKFANTLGKKSININNDINNLNWDEVIKIDKKKYDEYIHNYIKINLNDNYTLAEISDLVLNRLVKK